MLRGYVSGESEDWAAYLPIVEFAYNSTLHESTECSPFSLVYVTPPDEFPELPEDDESNRGDVLEEVARRLAAAKTNLLKAQAAQKRNYDRMHRGEVLQAGDLVFVSSRLLRLQGRGESKRGPRWIGPFPIIKRVSDLAYTVDFPPWMRLHRTINIGFLRKCEVSERYPRLWGESKQGLNSVPSAAEHSRVTRTKTADVHPYAIETILSSRQRTKRNGTTERQFLVKWQDTSLGETWENYETLSGVLSPGDLKLLQRTTAGEDTATYARGNCNGCVVTPRPGASTAVCVATR